MKKTMLKALTGTGLAVVMFAAVGCTGGTHKVSVAPPSAHAGQSDEDVAQLKAELAKKERAIKEYECALKEAEARAAAQPKVVAAAPVTTSDRSCEAQLLPPAKPGECYARVFVAPTYRTVTEKVLVKGPGEKIKVIPAKYKWVEERVLVKDAGERVEVIPAKYKWVEEKVLVKEPEVRYVEIPAKYKWVEEKVLVEPEHTVWKKGRGPIEKVDNATGEIMCLVKVPAKYRTVRKRVMVEPPRVKKIETPPVYKTVKKRVMVEPPRTRTITIPPVYKTVKKKVMVEPPKEQRIEIPPQYKTVTRVEKVSDGRLEWRRVLCETNATPAMIMKVQRALKRAGYDPGPIDGVLGKQTMNAIRAFQKKHGLATGGLTYETIKKLGVDIAS